VASRRVNRAYAALSQLLGFPGTTNLNKIGIDEAIPVHELAAVIEAGLVTRWAFSFEQSDIAGGATTDQSLSPYGTVGSPWSAILQNDQRTLATGEGIPSDEDIIVRHLAFSMGSTASNFTSGLWGESSGPWSTPVGPGNATRPLTNLLTLQGALGTVGNVALPATGDVYYTIPPPYFYPAVRRTSGGTAFLPRIRVVTANAVSWQASMEAVSAKPGIFRRW
jgi:hypothetical protein